MLTQSNSTLDELQSAHQGAGESDMKTFLVAIIPVCTFIPFAFFGDGATPINAGFAIGLFVGALLGQVIRLDYF